MARPIRIEGELDRKSLDAVQASDLDKKPELMAVRFARLSPTTRTAPSSSNAHSGSTMRSSG
ncbi:MAG: hypothetical protein DMF96_09570 [Acidobacteria bacterium]|nr:MAG: hypothetical protein DMF96_09570 [Acidobacteriota bacterium]